MKRETLEEKTSEELVELLKEDASLASKFDEYSLWSKIITWSYLLAEHPQFADKCDKLCRTEKERNIFFDFI